jgi:hypothetical protein
MKQIDDNNDYEMKELDDDDNDNHKDNDNDNNDCEMKTLKIFNGTIYHHNIQHYFGMNKELKKLTTDGTQEIVVCFICTFNFVNSL